jgi:hypothetical protein
VTLTLTEAIKAGAASLSSSKKDDQGFSRFHWVRSPPRWALGGSATLIADNQMIYKRNFALNTGIPSG